jgi:diketogulonate reductase-like aldo/keto reductase
VRTRSIAGVEVPVVGQGTWNLERDGRAQAVAALRAGLDAGMTHVDTAEMYGAGAVESLVGEAISGRRDEVFLVTKVLPSNASATGTLKACERSLERLRTDRIDVYLLHWPGTHPLVDTIGAFEELVRRGSILAYGVSNFDDEELERAVALAGPGRIACNQVLYHLKERAVEHRVLAKCERLGVTLVAYSPFGSDDFPSARSEGGRVLAGIAAAREATPRQIALAFLTRRSSVAAIPKSGRVEHALENARAGDLELSAAEVERIDRAFPKGRPRRGVPTI